MRKVKRGLAPVVCALAVLGSAGTALAADRYVALGDSYSSGTGTGSYLDDGTDCRRSPLAYPALVAAAGGYELNHRACNGATIPDVRAAQLDALSAATDKVSISIGGNDAGFVDVIVECALPAWASDCAGAVSTANAFIRDTLPGRLASLYAEIRTRAPDADVVVAGYPRLFMGEDCNAATFFSPADEELLNGTADLLAQTIGRQAAAAGFDFADVIPAFVGHAVCDDQEWVNGFSAGDLPASYHPNALGHELGYTPLVSSPLTGSALDVTASVLRAARAAAPEQAERQRAYAAQDACIEPEPLPTRKELRRMAERRAER